MIADMIEHFIENLIEKTMSAKLDWKNLSSFPRWDDIDLELRKEDFPIDFENMNSVRMQNSYYLQSGEGFVFLCEVYHGDPEVTSPEMDTVALMVKINNALPVELLSRYGDDQQKALRKLQLAVESYLEDRYAYPDVLYRFFKQVLSEDS